MLRLAIQSKGRLNEDSVSLLKEIGLRAEGSARKFIYKVPDFPLEILYMRDDDIPRLVANGTASLGIVGMNEVSEQEVGVKVERKLGFGGCRLSIAVPRNCGYDGPEWLNGKRIATSYPNMLRRYLAEQQINAKIEVITGSVEIAPATGIADAIFDIVSSGSTLTSNGLAEAEKVFESEAVLISGALAEEDRKTLDEMLFRIDSALMSSDKKYILMNLPESSVEEATRILPAMRSPTVMPLASKGWCSMHSVVEAGVLWDKIHQLKQIGAEGILVLNIDKIIP